LLRDVIGHENQSQHYPDHRFLCFRVIRTDYHAGRIFIPHRRRLQSDRPSHRCDTA